MLLFIRSYLGHCKQLISMRCCCCYYIGTGDGRAMIKTSKLTHCLGLTQAYYNWHCSNKLKKMLLAKLANLSADCQYAANFVIGLLNLPISLVIEFA